MSRLFDAISSVEFFTDQERRPLNNTIQGTVAACWYRDQPIVSDRNQAKSGLRLRFTADEGVYDLDGYPGMTSERILPQELRIFRTTGVKYGNGRAGLSIGMHEFSIGHPDVRLYIRGQASMWLDTPPITTIVVNRDDPRQTRIEWARG